MKPIPIPDDVFLVEVKIPRQVIDDGEDLPVHKLLLDFSDRKRVSHRFFSGDSVYFNVRVTEEEMLLMKLTFHHKVTITKIMDFEL